MKITNYPTQPWSELSTEELAREALRSVPKKNWTVAMEQLDARLNPPKPVFKLGNEYCGELSELVPFASVNVDPKHPNHVFGNFTLGDQEYYYTAKVFAQGDDELNRFSILEACKGSKWDGGKRVLAWNRGWDGSPTEWSAEQQKVARQFRKMANALGNGY